jgi:FdhD protein
VPAFRSIRLLHRAYTDGRDLDVSDVQTLAPVADASPTADVSVCRWDDGVITVVQDTVAEEWPVAFRYQGVPHVVMLATPRDLEDLAVGFTLTEAIVGHPSEIRGVVAGQIDDALEVSLNIAPERFSRLLERQRNLTGRTGCGMCGAETVDDAIRPPPTVRSGLRLTAADVQHALKSLSAGQLLNAATGSIHAAGWAIPGQGVVLVREDVGRHNALDKLIGALIRRGDDLSTGYVVISSRASYELVQKVATVGISTLVAVSAPTGFAIRSAERFGVTLVGFARPGRHVVYAHAERFSDRCLGEPS